MSITDPSADPVQPEGEGQGGEATSGGSPWESHLTRFPEEVRDIAAEVLREEEINANKRFEDHAEYRKTWEPYENLQVQKYDPETVKWLLDFYQEATQHPEAIKQWYLEQYAPQHGLIEQPQQQAPQQQPQDPFSFEQNGFQEPTPQQLEQLLDQRLGPLSERLQRFEAQIQQQEEQAKIAEANQYIQGQMSELRDKHPQEFTKEAETYVEALTGRYIDTDPLNAVPRAWADYQALVNQIQKSTLQEKVDQPKPPEGAGPPNTAPEKVTSLQQAGELALAQLRNANRA